MIEVEGYQGSTQLGLEARLLKEQKIFLDSEINADTATDLVRKLIYLEKQTSDEPVRLFINSPGGEVTSGLLIYDVLQAMKRDVEIYCAGIAASMAAVLLASGRPGHRHILPHSKTMIHEPLISSGVGGSATSICHISESIMGTKKLINELLSKHTGRSIEEINQATAYDNYMNAEESVKFGICDDISTDIF